jgi:hypothetical protein
VDLTGAVITCGCRELRPAGRRSSSSTPARWAKSHAASGQPRLTGTAKVTWRNAIEVPGMSALNRSGSAQVTALSCARTGKCSAGGYYHATHYGLYAGQVFVANER